MCSDKNVLKVRIYGAEYPVRGDRDIQYIKELAEYLDTKMREVNKNVRVDSSLRVAILAALNITDELFQERQKIMELRMKVEDKMKDIEVIPDKKTQTDEHGQR